MAITKRRSDSAAQAWNRARQQGVELKTQDTVPLDRGRPGQALAGLLVAVLAGAGYFALKNLPQHTQPDPGAPQLQPMVSDPHGNPWPEQTGYLIGTPVLNSTGHSQFVVENNTSERYLVHLVDIDQQPNLVVRQLYLDANDHFTMDSLSEGRYRVRKVSLHNGEALEMDRTFVMEVRPKNGGYVSTGGRLILEMPNGNTQTRPVDARTITGRTGVDL